MSIVIVGAGDIGIPLVEIATGSGNEVVVERDEGRAERASRQYDCLVINSDATTKETLHEAGTDRADAIIPTTDQDATNVTVCLLALELDVPEVVPVVHTPEHINLLRRIGVNTRTQSGSSRSTSPARSDTPPSWTSCASARWRKCSRSSPMRRRRR